MKRNDFAVPHEVIKSSTYGFAWMVCYGPLRHQHLRQGYQVHFSVTYMGFIQCNIGNQWQDRGNKSYCPISCLPNFWNVALTSFFCLLFHFLPGISPRRNGGSFFASGAELFSSVWAHAKHRTPIRSAIKIYFDFLRLIRQFGKFPFFLQAIGWNLYACLVSLLASIEFEKKIDTPISLFRTFFGIVCGICTKQYSKESVAKQLS